MMPDLNSLMVWAATYFIHSTLLLGFVWLWFRQREPASHAFREAIWKLAAVGGIITASLQLGLEIESPFNTALSVAWNKTFSSESVTSPTRDGGAFAADRGTLLIHDPAERNEFVQEEVSDSESIEPFFLLPSTARELATAPNENAMSEIGSSHPARELENSHSEDVRAQASASGLGLDPRWRGLLVGMLVGMLAAFCGAIVALSSWGLVRLLSEQWEFRQRLATCHLIADGKARNILDELLQDSGVRRRVRLMLDEHDLEPGACGWFNWQIVLPARAVEDLSSAELRGLLAHELAHLVRGDQWWLLLGRLLAVCFGWQPLNRIALREWQRASEYLCDAWAIQRSVPRLSLARCLTTVAEWRLVGLATVAGLGSGNPSNLSQRVERLVDDVPLADPWQRYSRRHLLAAAGCAIAVGMVSLAPAATLPGRPPVNAGKLASDAPSAELLPAFTETRLVAEGDADPELPDRVELLATDIDPVPADVLVTIEMINVIRRQVSTDMLALTSELDALQRAILQMPQASDHPLWHLQIRRFQERLEKIRRLRSAMLVPL